MNWMYCRRCGKLYANLEMVIIPTRYPKHPPDNECRHCHAELEGVIESPTLTKTYASSHLRSLWLSAIQELALADTWVFCGYSMPSEDAWVMTLLLRAISARADRLEHVTRSDMSDRPVVNVILYVNGATDDQQAETHSLTRRYREILGRAQVIARPGGFERMIADS